MAVSASRIMASALTASRPDGEGHADAHRRVDLRPRTANGASKQRRMRSRRSRPVDVGHVVDHDEELVAADAGDESRWRTDCWSRSATSTSSSSPAECPIVSLSSLKRSRSRNSSATWARLRVAALVRCPETRSGSQAVGQPGERVVGRLVGQARLRPGVLAECTEDAPDRGAGQARDDHGEHDAVADGLVVCEGSRPRGPRARPRRRSGGPWPGAAWPARIGSDSSRIDGCSTRPRTPGRRWRTAGRAGAPAP